jgi:hypothetical protein
MTLTLIVLLFVAAMLALFVVSDNLSWKYPVDTNKESPGDPSKEEPGNGRGSHGAAGKG